eukprot:Pgem_evm1s8625
MMLGEKPGVINLSLTFSGPNPIVDAVINEAIEVGMAVVVAAGNVAEDACNSSPS